jgi:anti-anti-sigma regulatory factor
MLRIHVDDQSKSVTLYIEGKLSGDAVDELRRVWTSLRIESPGKQIVADLSSVRVVDCTGRKLLSQMHGWGTRLAGAGLMIGPLIEEITNAASCSDSEFDKAR